MPWDVDVRVHLCAATSQGTEPADVLKAASMPDGITYEGSTLNEHGSAAVKEIDMPRWAFLQIHGDGIHKKERNYCISFDGKHISTKLLAKKKTLLETEKAYGKRIGRTGWNPAIWESGEVNYLTLSTKTALASLRRFGIAARFS